MQFAICSACQHKFSMQGIYGHLRFKHGIENPDTSMFTVSIEPGLDFPSIQSDTYPFPTRSPVAVVKAVTGDALEQRRQDLEMKKIEIEMARLEKGNTAVDPYALLLKMSEDHNAAMLKMHEQNFDTRLEIERLKLMGSGGDDLASNLISTLLPLLPDMLSRAKIEKPVVNTEKKEEVKKDMDLNDPRLDGYKKMIREGKITETQAWKQAGIFDKKARDAVGREKFHEEFEKIKNSKA